MSRRLLQIASLIVMIGLPVAALSSGQAKLVPFLAMPLFVLGGPMLFGMRNRKSGPEAESGDDNDSDDGGGGNRKPDRGPTTPSGPTGLMPLADSTQGNWRLRGNGRQRVSDPGRRREPHQPPQTPRRVPAGPQHF